MRILCFLFFLGCSILLQGQFTKVTTDTLTAAPHYSTFGCAMGDWDGDSIIDVFSGNFNNTANGLYTNNGLGNFTKVAPGPFASDGNHTSSGSWGDYNNDGYLDIFIANWNGNNFLYRNDSNVSFTKITTGNIATDGGTSYGGTFGDYDNDGYLDVFVSNNGQNNFLYRNNGNGSFTKITTGAIVTDGGASRSSAWGDYDNDGYLDLYVCNISGVNFLYRNNGNGTFTKVTTGSIATDVGTSYGCSWGDYDQDRDLDLYVVNGNSENNWLYRNDGGGTFTKVMTGPHVTDAKKGRASSWLDYDNDGDLDLFVGNWALENNLLFRNDSTGFVQVSSSPITSDGGHTMGASFGDVDKDGDLDVFMSNDFATANFYYTNNGNSNNWIAFDLVGMLSNRSGIGAKVSIYSKGEWQMIEVSGQTGHGGQNSLTAEYGIGNSFLVDTLVIDWPSCHKQVLTDPSINTFHVVPELEILNQPVDVGACGGQSVSFDASGNSISGLDYQWYFNGTAMSNGGNVSGATGPLLTLNPSMASDTGQYFCRVRIACDTNLFLYSDSAKLTNQGSPSSQQSIQICAGDSTQLPGGTFVSSAGTYSDTISGFPCDSIITTILTVDPLPTATDSVMICQGDSHQLSNGNWVSQSGTYGDTISKLPCDSVYATVLSVEICNQISEGLNAKMILFPNPSRGEFRLRFPTAVAEDFKVELIDLQGRRVLSNWRQVDRTIVLIELAMPRPGVFILRIENSGETLFRKISVK